MRGGPIECEALRQGPSHPSQPFDRFFSSANTAYFELPLARNPNLDLIPVLKLQSFHNGCGKSDG
jgi:hypothetical protein